MLRQSEEIDRSTELSEHLIDDLPLGVLHLGTKTAWFEQAGYRTIGSVRDLDIDRMIRIPLIGRTTANELVRKRDALLAACRNGSGIDWTEYCAAIDIPLLPEQGGAASGPAFLLSIPAFLRTVASKLPDVVSEAILRDRICRAPNEQKTLEDIGQLAAPPLTRERVRQKEAKLLRELTGGLLNDGYDTLGIHFHPDFSRWWRKAADVLAELDEIEVTTFVDILCGAWGVPQAGVMEQLPAIVAIVTGEPQMSGAFRAAARINARLFGTLSDSFGRLPVHRLRLGKHADILAETGFPTVGSLIAALQSGALSRAGDATAKRAAAHLETIAACMMPEGDADWAAFRKVVRLERLPAMPIESNAAFVTNLRGDIERLLRIHPVTKRSVEIFGLRTGRDAGQRMTLHQAAEKLETFPSTIKREETVLLQWLNDVVVTHDFSALEVWLDDDWLHCWDEAREVFKTSEGEYERFLENLAWRWRLADQVMRNGAPAMWAVLAGYPDGRRSGWKPAAVAPVDPPSLGVIQLRGFRRHH